MAVKNDGTEKMFVDTGPPVITIPPDKEIKTNKKISPQKRKYKDVNENKVKFAGKVTVEAESRGIGENFRMVYINRDDMKPLLGMDWLREFNSMIRNKESTTTTTDESEKIKLKANLENVFRRNLNFNDTEIKIQLKPGHLMIKKETRPFSYHLQSFVEKEINKLIQSEHLKKIQNADKECFVSLVVITVKKDKSVKKALDSKKLNDSCLKMRSHKPNMEELRNRRSTEQTRVQHEPLWISKIYLEYGYGQLKESKETSTQCNFAITGGNMNRYYRI